MQSPTAGDSTRVRRFHRDATTGRIVLTDLSKAEYTALDADIKKQVKAYFRFSPNRAAWISKGATYSALQIAQRVGLEDGGVEAEDERLSFAEQIEQKQERAAARAVRREGYAASAQAASDSLYEAGMDDLRRIPFGQPIQPPGHHSHKGDKAYRERAGRKVERSFEEADRAKHHREQAAIAAHAADAPELRSPAFLARRVNDAETEIRRLRRLLDVVRTESGRARLEEATARAEEKLAYYRERLDDAGGALYTSATLKGARRVMIERHGWVYVYSVGPKFLTVGDHGCSWKVLAGEVLGAEFATEHGTEVTR